MKTFSFIELMNQDTLETRVIAIRGTTCKRRQWNAFDAFRRRNPRITITAMYEVEKCELADAREWLEECFRIG